MAIHSFRFLPGMMRALLLLLIWGLLLPSLPDQATAKPRKPRKAPYAAAVLPFEDNRNPGRPDWLGRYLWEAIHIRLLRAPRSAVLPLETSYMWARKLAGTGQNAPSPAFLKKMGVDVALAGSTQVVLSLGNVNLRLVGPEGDLVPPTALEFHIRLEREPPASVLRRIMTALRGGLEIAEGKATPPLPETWPEVEKLYTLLERIPVANTEGARPRLIARLEPLMGHPTLGGRVRQALALLHMEQAMLHVAKGRQRRAMLRKALAHIKAALAADPLDLTRKTLKGEIHYFLGEYFEAKTEASIARIKNPLNALAFVVLGLVSGISTGEASENFQRALAMDPFLRQSERPPGSPPFQGGLLEPYFVKWEELRARNRHLGRPEYQELLAQGIELFELGNWDAADETLRDAVKLEEGDYAPWLYLYRIMVETGAAEDAVPLLRQLARENPYQADILLYMGIALKVSGEYEAGRNVLHRYLREEPDDPDALYHLSAIDAGAGRWKDVLASMRSLVRLQPNRAEFHVGLGVSLEKLGNSKAALKSYSEALRLDPKNREARINLARLRGR